MVNDPYSTGEMKAVCMQLADEAVEKCQQISRGTDRIPLRFDSPQVQRIVEKAKEEVQRVQEVVASKQAVAARKKPRIVESTT